MERKGLAAKNSLIGLINQFVNMIMQFALRTVFINYLGVELLGINSTLTSVLNTLSISELGFQTAVVYRLYVPLKEGNQKAINDIIVIFKTVYRFISGFIVLAGIVSAPFLKYIITKVDISWYIYVYYFLIIINSAVSYQLSYKRTLLYADKRDYYSKIVDTVCIFVISLLKAAVIIFLKSYILYLAATILQTVVTNFIIHRFCGKLYPYLKKTKFSRDIFKLIFKDVKDIFVSKIAGFVYNSTDNLLLSIFTGTVTVGYFVNYTTVTAGLKTMINSALNPITPIIGNMLTDNDKGKNKRVLYQYTFIRFVMAVCIIIPFFVLIQDFISVWVGKEFLLSKFTVILISADLYIFLIHNLFCDFINGSGLFRAEKYIEIGSAVINIVSSVILVQFFDIEGVLLGTVLTQVFCWISRSLLVFCKCLRAGIRGYLIYWLKSLVYVVVFLAELIICLLVYDKLLAPLHILPRLIIGAVVCECLVLGITFLVFIKTGDERTLLSWIHSLLRKKLIKS